jgi:hypothetical protein
MIKLGLGSWLKIGAVVTSFTFALWVTIFLSRHSLEGSDAGFIQGLSWSIWGGEKLYSDVIYARPPVSPLLHSLWFTAPFDWAPIYIARIASYLQVAVYSFLIVAAAARMIGMEVVNISVCFMIVFVLNLHNFPAMPWHTIDGIFFGVAAVSAVFWIARQKVLLASSIGFALALLSAGSKQPFYIVPFITLFALALRVEVRQWWKIGLAFGLVVIIFGGGLSMTVDFEAMLASVRSETRLSDLIDAGFVDFLRDWHSVSALIFAGPISVYMMYYVAREFVPKLRLQLMADRALFIFCLTCILVGLGRSYVNTDQWSSGVRLMDAVFVGSALFCVGRALKSRTDFWHWLLAVHMIAWAASISWGYVTVALLCGVTGLVIVVMAFELFGGGRLASIGCFVVAIFLCCVTLVGHRYVYSLDGPLPRSTAIVEGGQVAPVLRGVLLTPEQADTVGDLFALSQHFGTNFVTAPDWPLSHAIVGVTNPLGVPWLLNAEVGLFEPVVLERLAGVEYAFVHKFAQPEPEAPGRFGSRVTQIIISEWSAVDSGSKHFDVYRNPAWPAVSGPGQ